MAIVFNKIARKNPRDKSVKYYPSVKVVGRKTEKDLMERICRNTTLNEREAMMALAEVRQGIMDFLLDGYSVEFSDWASFRQTVTAKGAETVDKCDATLVRKVNVRCTLKKEFQEEVPRTFSLCFSADCPRRAECSVQP
ncbi:MAG: hypothetical protein SPL50_08440 [Alloprevotella sp.]|nr:hypothetical protein [Alloprevotella sp.]